MNKTIFKILYWVRHATQGQDLVEYALMAGFVAVAGGAIFPTTIAPNISSIFSKVNSYLQATPSGVVGS